MLDRGIIVATLDSYHFKVRIPSLNKSDSAVGGTPNNELYTAVVSSSPGVYPALRVGDVVIVGYENDDVSRPIIIGLLFNRDFSDTESDAIFSSLTVNVNAVLPEDTSIGEITSDNIYSLKNLDMNIREKFNTQDIHAERVDSELLGLHSDIVRIDETDMQQQQCIDSNSQQISDNAAEIESHSNTLDEHKRQLDEHKRQLDDHASKLNTIDDSVSLLDTELTTLSNDFTAHKNDKDLHITSSDRTSWDNKADKDHTHASFNTLSVSDLTVTKKLVVDNSMFGSSAPTGSGTTGQIYFKLEE